MLLFKIRALRPYISMTMLREFSLVAFSTCTPLCRRAMMCLYLRHQAFRSEQSRYGRKAINSFSL